MLEFACLSLGQISRNGTREGERTGKGGSGRSTPTRTRKERERDREQREGTPASSHLAAAATSRVPDS